MVVLLLKDCQARDIDSDPCPDVSWEPRRGWAFGTDIPCCVMHTKTGFQRNAVNMKHSQNIRLRSAESFQGISDVFDCTESFVLFVYMWVYNSSKVSYDERFLPESSRTGWNTQEAHCSMMEFNCRDWVNHCSFLYEMNCWFSWVPEVGYLSSSWWTNLDPLLKDTWSFKGSWIGYDRHLSSDQHVFYMED